MRYERNLKALRKALEIHRTRSEARLHGTRFLLRETIFYEWECRRGCTKWLAPRFISRQAKKGGREDWGYEHAIPLSIVFKQLEGLKRNPSLESVRRVLEQWDIPVIVTKEESVKLKEEGLQHKMPDGWPGPRKPFARYDYCKIRVDRKPPRGQRGA